jgi:hypothetical protein
MRGSIITKVSVESGGVFCRMGIRVGGRAIRLGGWKAWRHHPSIELVVRVRTLVIERLKSHEGRRAWKQSSSRPDPAVQRGAAAPAVLDRSLDSQVRTSRAAQGWLHRLDEGTRAPAGRSHPRHAFPTNSGWTDEVLIRDEGRG